MSKELEELFPVAGNTQTDIDKFRQEVMAGMHKDLDERPEQEDMPVKFKDVESQLIEALKFQKELEAKVKELQQRLLEEMQENDIKSWKSDRMTITRILPQVRETFDSKRFKAEHEDLYSQYTKESTTKESIKITLKKQEL